MNTKEIYITLKGDRKVILNDRVISWNDPYGHHEGRVIGYGRTANQSGSPVTYLTMVYKVDCGDDGIRELRQYEMRDIIEG